MRVLKYVFSLGFLLSILLTGCGPKVDSDKKTARSMSSFSSYAFLPNQDTIMTTRYNNAYVNEIIIDEVNENMQDKDYRLDRNQPDLLVYYHLMMDEDIAANANPVYTNYRYYRPGYYVGPYYRNYAYNNYYTVPRITGSNIEQVPYKEGTLVIDLIDRRTNEIVWRGMASDVITPNNLEEELRTYVNAIFESLPK
ncbi:DUF4136 domain-containing protein [Salinimicrobium flavum]|uniref:DUF4136 domain-containing protein n=1 Tax=Salinimicrobium flavum TaxID=1737065 RepID=A0ABW5IRL1_9FLAO